MPAMAMRSGAPVRNDPLVAFEDQLSSLRGDIHLRDETFLAELLAMRSHGIHGSRHIPGGVRDLAAPFVPRQPGCDAARARASGDQDQHDTDSHDSHRKPHFGAGPGFFTANL